MGAPARPGRARRLQPRQPPARRARPGDRDPRLRRLLPHGARGRRRRRGSRRSCAGGRPRTRSGSARIALDGFASRLPLEPLELELLGDLVAARLAAIVSISAWRSRRFPENAAYIEAWDEDSWRLLELLDGLDPEEVACELGGRRAAAASPELVRRRNEAFGALLTPLTYARPRARDPRRGRLDPRAGRTAGSSTPTTTSRSSATATHG